MYRSDAGFGILSFLEGGSIFLFLLIVAWFIAQFLLPFFVAAINNKLAKVLEGQDYIRKEIRDIRRAVAPDSSGATPDGGKSHVTPAESPEAAAVRQRLPLWPPSEADNLRAIINDPNSSDSERQEAKKKLDEIVMKMLGTS